MFVISNRILRKDRKFGFAACTAYEKDLIFNKLQTMVTKMLYEQSLKFNRR